MQKLCNKMGMLYVTNRVVKRYSQCRVETVRREELEYEAIKEAFLNNMSHEINTPLTLMMMNIQMLELGQGEMGTSNEKYIKSLKQNCHRLYRLTNNLLELTKIDIGESQVEWKNWDIVNIVENIVKRLQPYIQNKGIDLKINTNLKKRVIACDVEKIECIILNLLANAIKFTEKGNQVMVSLSEECGKWVQIIVKDTGDGIPQDKKDIIFNHFRQVDKSLTRRHEGCGIGLTLVKALVELHEGKITLESEEGKGSEFVVKLPVTKLLGEEVQVYDTSDRLDERIKMEFSDIYF